MAIEIRDIKELPELKQGRGHDALRKLLTGLTSDQAVLIVPEDGDTCKKLLNRLSVRATSLGRALGRKYHTRQSLGGIWMWWTE